MTVLLLFLFESKLFHEKESLGTQTVRRTCSEIKMGVSQESDGEKRTDREKKGPIERERERERERSQHLHAMMVRDVEVLELV
jgi:hypothetical protein